METKSPVFKVKLSICILLIGKNKNLQI